MTPAALTRLHARCFAAPPPWSADSFATLLQNPHVFLLVSPDHDAFALGRAIGPEVELLTLATDPQVRRRGLARALMDRFAAEARERRAETVFLEVAEDNAAAIALYRSLGFVQTGQRPGYYRSTGRPPVSALLFSMTLA
ncbi:MAG: ribosomal-protein-alanine N-acetyltransferase [Rhodobacteraceae bacterium HLUCCA12]|nr:MAG: ribosomal-protein-alanine N-acetyltransferase [Rhodobacteraceae bacterium HLUCCA12]